MFEIKIVPEFEAYVEKLALAKKVLLSSKLSYLESSGHLGNCRMLNGGALEFAINRLNDSKIYCIVDNANNFIIFANDPGKLREVDRENLKSWRKINDENLKDVKYAKSYFEEIMAIYQETSDDEFLLKELKNIFDNQGKGNFKSMAGFDLADLDVSKPILTLRDLQNKLKLTIKIKSISYLTAKSGLSEQSVRSLLKIREDFNLKDVNNLIKYFSRK
jgi:hypothetical protein